MRDTPRFSPRENTSTPAATEVVAPGGEQLVSAREQAVARLFLSLPVPEPARGRVREVLQRFPQYIERTIPEANWHLTLFFLGEVENPGQYWSRLTKALPQAYVPTISLTHVGRGLHRTQLWAYAHPSTILLNLRQQLFERLRSMRFPLPKKTDQDFVPHIRLATLYPMARGIGLADESCTVSYVVSAIELNQSRLTPTGAVYRPEATISLKG